MFVREEQVGTDKRERIWEGGFKLRRMKELKKRKMDGLKNKCSSKLFIYQNGYRSFLIGYLSVEGFTSIFASGAEGTGRSGKEGRAGEKQ